MKNMNILEDLWFGNISPWERPFKKDSAYAELLALVVRHQEDLLSRLNDEDANTAARAPFSRRNRATVPEGRASPYSGKNSMLKYSRHTKV